jgi:hypothetical protein
MVLVIGIGTTDRRYYREGTALYQQLHAMGIRVHLLTATSSHSWPLWAKQYVPVSSVRNNW